MTLTVGSLFSGIGGLDLGLENAGMKVIWQSEIDPYACKILKKHWPDTPNLGNIKDIDWSNCERPDVICGGYPCQPFSLAGERRGTDDPRHLWPYIKEAARILRPKYLILENVPGHLSLGLGQVLGDLAEIGYDAEWEVVSAKSVGAPHIRERLFIVAYPNLHAYLPSSDTMGRQSNNTSTPRRSVVLAKHLGRNRWAAEPDVPRVDDGVPNRMDRTRCLGNAVVPQVAEMVGKLVMEATWSR